MDERKLELYQLWKGICRQSFTSDANPVQLNKVRDYFARNGMGVEEKEGVFRVTSPFLLTAIKELETKLTIKFVGQKTRLVE